MKLHETLPTFQSYILTVCVNACMYVRRKGRERGRREGGKRRVGGNEGERERGREAERNMHVGNCSPSHATIYGTTSNHTRTVQCTCIDVSSR